VQHLELFEGLADLNTLTGAHQNWESGAATILDKNVQEMLTLMKKHDSQELAGLEREHNKNCSSDAIFHKDQSCAPVPQAKKRPFIFQNGTTGRWSPFEKQHRSISKRVRHNALLPGLD
jgi:hypothetical protein